MGRGRAKAKQTKVARELKYYSPETDLRALEAELQAKSTRRSGDGAPDDENAVDDDDYESWSATQQ